MTADLYMGFTYPLDHDSADVWGALLVSALGTIGAHDHTSGKGKPVPSLGIGINADLTFSSFAAINMKALDFAAVASSGVTTYAGALFMSDGSGGLAANELYWRTTTGVNVKLTTGAALNIAGFAGGIGGDYSTVGAVATYEDAGKRYMWKEGTADAFGWARMASADVRLYPAGGLGANYVGQACPGAIASPYTMTWPLALPGAAAAVQVDNTGALSFSNTFAAGVTAGANQNFTVSGTGAFKHGTQTLHIPASAFALGTIGGSLTISGGSAATVAPILLARGRRILAIRIFVADSATGPTTIRGIFASLNLSTGVESSISTSSDSAGSGAQQTLTISPLTTTVAASTSYYFYAKIILGTATVTINGAEVDYDYP